MPASTRPPDDAPFRVLVVDDTAEHTRVVRSALTHAGHPVAFASADTAEAALETLQSGVVEPDLILLDINLPGLSGLDLLATVKADPALRRIPVVMLTASEQLADVERAYALGASGYLAKPTRPIELQGMVRHTLLYWATMRRTTVGRDHA
jgi:CheY-like chemotaxis protein